MRGCLRLGVIVGILGSVQPALAQQPAGSPAVWRLGGARSATPSGPGRLKEVRGVLVSDAGSRQIRFEADGRTTSVIPYERIVAMHYERAQYPRRFLRRSSFYLTVHYSDVVGSPASETVRLLSERDALAAMATLTRDTGGTFHRSAAARSFLGVPIRAGVGTRVVITDQVGRTTKGVMTQLSAASLTLNESPGVVRVFEDASIRKIRLLYSPKRNALVGFGFGAGIGAFSGAIVGAGAGSGCGPEGCHVLAGAALGAGVAGGVGTLIGVTIGAMRYPFNDAFDVYRGDTRDVSTTSVAIAPQLTRVHKSVLVSVRF